MKAPLVSVVVPTFDRAPLLRQCIGSLLAQTLVPHQILIVDDGSRDNTPEVIDTFGELVSSIRTENLGKSGAVNRGLEEVDGEFIWVLDDDDIALPDALERFVKPLVDSGKYGFSYSTKFFCNIDSDGVVTEILGQSRVPEAYNRGFVLSLMKSCFLGGASTLVRRSVYEEVGGYDVSLFRSQDYEMAVRIALRFPGARASGGPTYYHRVHEGLRGNLAERFPSEQRAQKWQEYNQQFVRRLCNELPLERFSPVEDDSLTYATELLPALERTAVRAAHELIDDVVTDIRLIASGAFKGPVTRLERLVAEEIGRRLAVVRTLPQGFTGLLRATDPRMAPVISAISRHFRLGSTWHSLPRPVRHVLRFARSAVVSTVVDG